jgi:hypothetical protein
MLEFLGFQEARGDRCARGVHGFASGMRPPDLGGGCVTKEVGEAVREAVLSSGVDRDEGVARWTPALHQSS